jgi:hypothetical protein
MDFIQNIFFWLEWDVRGRLVRKKANVSTVRSIYSIKGETLKEGEGGESAQ